MDNLFYIVSALIAIGLLFLIARNLYLMDKRESQPILHAPPPEPALDAEDTPTAPPPAQPPAGAAPPPPPLAAEPSPTFGGAPPPPAPSAPAPPQPRPAPVTSTRDL